MQALHRQALGAGSDGRGAQGWKPALSLSLSAGHKVPLGCEPRAWTVGAMEALSSLYQTLWYLIPRFLARDTEVFPHRPPGQLPAAGPGSGPALLHQGQGSTGPASHYQMAGHQPQTLLE